MRREKQRQAWMRRSERGRTAVGKDDLKRLLENHRREIEEGARPFKELLEGVRQGEVKPPPLPPDVREEVHRGAEFVRRALSLARYIGHHSRKGRGMR